LSPRSEEQLSEIREGRILEILSSARTLFAYKGFDVVSVNDIAKKVGISKGLIYNYFDSKNDVLEAIMKPLFDMFNMFFEQSNTLENPKMILDLVIEESFRFYFESEEKKEEQRELVHLFMQSSVIDRYSKQMGELYEKSVVIITRALKDLDYKQPEFHARMIAAFIDGLQFHAMLFEDRVPVKDMIEYIKSFYMKKRG